MGRYDAALEKQIIRPFSGLEPREAAARTGAECACRVWALYLSVELLSNTELRNAVEQQVVHRPKSVATAAD